jgi:hypothetical protein
MDSNFGGFAAFLVFAVITGVIGFLAVQQGKIKRDIEARRRKREQEDLIALGGIDPNAPNLPNVQPTDITPGAPSHHAPEIGDHGHDPGASSNPPSSDSGGTWSGSGGSDGGGGHHH